MTHYIEAGGRPVNGLYVAFCGTRCLGTDFSATPECPACRQALADDFASLLSLRHTTAERFGGPPVKHQPFDPMAVPRAERRRR